MDPIDVKAWDDRFRQVHGGCGPHLLLASVLVPHVGARIQYGECGIVIAALAVRRSTNRPLVVLWDGPDNPGASATNAMHALLAWAAAFWPLYPVRDARLLQRDSAGCFDEVVATWTGEPPAPARFTWRPVLAPQASPRTWGAVQATLGMDRAADVGAITRGQHSEKPQP